MLFKKTLFTGMLVASISTVAHASALTIVNDTNRDSTCIINSTVCSTIIGDGGVTKAHTKNVVSEGNINKACFFNKVNCKADVYMTNNCKGPKIATVIFDTQKGIKSVSMNDNAYQITGVGFNITLSGGPTPLAAK